MYLGSKLIQLDDSDNRTILYWCPGCEEHHGVCLDGPNSMGSQWSWNNSTEAPTFHPSVNVTQHDATGMMVVGRCHSWVRDGKIEYLMDSTHNLAGHTVDMVDIKEN